MTSARPTLRHIPRSSRPWQDDFKKHGYDLRYLIRLIVQSRTYQVTAGANETNMDDRINYSRAYARPLDAEVLLDAISQVTGVGEDFRVQSRRRPGPSRNAGDQYHLARYLPSTFLDVYGRPNRIMVPERKVEAKPAASVAFAGRHDLYGQDLPEGGRLDRLLQARASNRQIIENFYLAGVARFPTARELAELESEMNRRESRPEALEDMAWGLVASREFSYNH